MIDDKLLEAFPFGLLQDCKNVMQILARNGFSQEDFFEWLKDKSKRILPVPRSAERMRPARAVLHRLCPGCEERFLRLQRVNDRPERMVGDLWKCQWYCSVCGWEEYSERELNEEAKPYIKGV